MDGRMYHSNFSYSAGGVGRNICESLYKLGVPSNFITIIGNDDTGHLARKSLPTSCSDLIQTKGGSRTAQCVIVFNNKGDCQMLMGDMEIHKEISPEMIKDNEKFIENSPLLILDGNLTKEALSEALKIAVKHNVPGLTPLDYKKMMEQLAKLTSCAIGMIIKHFFKEQDCW